MMKGYLARSSPLSATVQFLTVGVARSRLLDPWARCPLDHQHVARGRYPFAFSIFGAERNGETSSSRLCMAKNRLPSNFLLKSRGTQPDQVPFCPCVLLGTICFAMRDRDRTDKNEIAISVFSIATEDSSHDQDLSATRIVPSSLEASYLLWAW
jgi:hypothetical protein